MGDEAKQKAITAVIEVRDRFVRLIISLATGLLALPPLLIEKGRLPILFETSWSALAYQVGFISLCLAIASGLIWILTSPDLIKHAYGQGELAKHSSEEAESRMDWWFNWMIGYFLVGGLLTIVSAWLLLDTAPHSPA